MFGLIVGKTGTFLLKRVLEKAIYTRLKLPHQGGGKLPPTILPKYKLDEIYTADEFGMYFSDATWQKNTTQKKELRI